MFAKPFKAKDQQLKGKDVKLLKKAAAQQFPPLQDEALMALLFPNKEDVTLHKIDQHLMYFSVAKDPIFFDDTGRMDGMNLYPSVYAMWKVPNPNPSHLEASSRKGWGLRAVAHPPTLGSGRLFYI